ncbi:MAG: hypothetical protein WA359_07105 [Acidimicrobiales bacterium]
MPSLESLRDRWPDFPGLEASVELTDQTVVAGSTGRGHVLLRNAEGDLIEFDTDRPFVAKVLDPSTKEIVAGNPGPMLATGLPIRLKPGEETSVRFVFGTTTSRDSEAIALAPGDYLVKVDLPVHERRPDGDGSEKSYLTMPLTPARLVRVET